jgi:hypothetical protein
MRFPERHLWYNAAMALLVAAIVADLIEGLHAVLNAVSVIVAIVAALAVLTMVGAGVVLCCWIVVRDAVLDLRFDRRNGNPWRWRLVGYAGIIGLLVDGAIGAWMAFHEHILFSAAVAHIRFAGVPVALALASYPLRWLEQTILRLRRDAKKGRAAAAEPRRRERASGAA